MTLPADMVDVLMERIQSRRIVENECFVYPGDNPRGYRLVGLRVDGKDRRFYVHRIAYEAAVGEIPDGIHIHHRCHNRACFNTDHLEPIPAGEHARRHHQLGACGVCGSTRRRQMFRNGRPNGNDCLDCSARRQREARKD